MKLYYAPGACSQAPHIILHEVGIHHDAAKVDLRSKMVEDGRSYLQINSKGAVPTLELDNGEILTENAVILQYLGDRSGSSDVLPPIGDFRRYRVLEWMNFVSTELHKGFGPLFKPNAGEETKRFAKELIASKLDWLNGAFGSGPFLTGEQLTIADAYLFPILGWPAKFNMDLDRWPNLAAFRERMLQRPAVRHVLRFEGLLEEQTAG